MKLSNILINQKNTLREAMLRMNEFCLDTIFVVNDENILQGVLTDGDVRRKLLNGFKLEDLLIKVMNTNFTAASINDKREDVLKLRKNGIKTIPLVDEVSKVLGCIGQEIDEYIPIYDIIFEGNELEYLTDCIKIFRIYRIGWLSIYL